MSEDQNPPPNPAHRKWSPTKIINIDHIMDQFGNDMKEGSKLYKRELVFDLHEDRWLQIEKYIPSDESIVRIFTALKSPPVDIDVDEDDDDDGSNSGLTVEVYNSVKKKMKTEASAKDDAVDNCEDKKIAATVEKTDDKKIAAVQDVSPMTDDSLRSRYLLEECNKYRAWIREGKEKISTLHKDLYNEQRTNDVIVKNLAKQMRVRGTDFNESQKRDIKLIMETKATNQEKCDETLREIKMEEIQIKNWERYLKVASAEYMRKELGSPKSLFTQKEDADEIFEEKFHTDDDDEAKTIKDNEEASPKGKEEDNKADEPNEVSIDSIDKIDGEEKSEKTH
jgi:hypothetical protein